VAALLVAPTSAALAAPDLAKAVAERNIGKIDKLLAAGGPVDEADADGRTPLFHAASHGDAGLIQRLLDKGASPNSGDKDGDTPLIVALRNPTTQLAAVRPLLDKGADINAADKAGRTPLMEAVLRAPEILDTDGEVAVVKALLEAGADPEKADANGATALHHAGYVGEPRKVLELLLVASKKPDATTSSGANVLMMAAQNHQRANFDYLLAKDFRPVLIHAVGADRPPLAQDLSPRANAYGLDWWGQYAARKGDAAASKAAFASAAEQYDAAIAEARRVSGLYEEELAKDKKARAEERGAAVLASVLTTAATFGAGYWVAWSPIMKTKVEQDEHALAALKTEIDESTARAAALRAQIAANP
jgi:hypothetical protein